MASKIGVRNMAIVLLVLLFTVLFISLSSCAWGFTRTAKELIMNTFQKGSLEDKIVGVCLGKKRSLMDMILDNKTYIVLLQNNMELRASGGFMGSYLKFRTNNRGISEMTISDIYVPDGQIQGHVEPPYPIQEAFEQGWWRLRDSNWDIDFEKAAQSIVWFLEKGGETNVDGVVAINLSLAKGLIDIYGPLKINTYDQIVDAGNFYSLAQKYAEIGFFPGSTQKRDFLGAVTVVLEEEMKSAGLVKTIKTGELVWNELNAGQILVWFKAQDIQKEIVKNGWDGGINGKWDKNSDYLYIVESNLGVNKANCCIERTLEKNYENNNNIQESRLKIHWKNNNLQSVPKPPESWGGDYVDYVRMVIPENWDVLNVIFNGAELTKMEEGQLNGPSSLRQGMSTDKYDEFLVGDRLKVIGFWANVGAGKEGIAEILTRNTKIDGKKYGLYVRRQPGIEKLPIKIIEGGKIEFNGVLIKDAYLKWKRG